MFVPLADAPPMVRAVRMLSDATDSPPAVAVAASESLFDTVRETLGGHQLSFVTVVLADGAGTWGQCLAAGLDHFAPAPGGPDHVLVHDIRRPLASVQARDRVIAGLRAGAQAVVPALPLTDSVKTVDSNGTVAGTLDRATLRAVQYPRGFTVSQLSALLAAARHEEFDELVEMLAAGIPVTVVDGDPDAFAVDLPGDAALVAAIVASRRAERR